MNKLYMNIHTGSVSEYEDWISPGIEGASQQDVKDCISNGTLVEVQEDEDGFYNEI